MEVSNVRRIFGSRWLWIGLGVALSFVVWRLI